MSDAIIGTNSMSTGQTGASYSPTYPLVITRSVFASSSSADIDFDLTNKPLQWIPELIVLYYTATKDTSIMNQSIAELTVSDTNLLLHPQINLHIKNENDAMGYIMIDPLNLTSSTYYAKYDGLGISEASNTMSQFTVTVTIQYGGYHLYVKEHHNNASNNIMLRYALCIWPSLFYLNNNLSQ